MTITIDMLSLFIGMIIGLFITTISFCVSYFDDRHHTAFGSGWDCGYKYGRSEKKKDGEKE